MRVALVGVLLPITCLAQTPADAKRWVELLRAGAELQTAGRYSDSAESYREALKIAEALPARDPRLAKTMNNLAAAYFYLGKYAEAEPLFRRALEIWREGPDAARVLTNLAALCVRMARYPEAETLYGDAIRAAEKAFGTNDPATAATWNNAGELYRVLGRFGDAVDAFQHALSIWLAKGEETAASTAMNNLAAVYGEQRRFDEAEALYRRAAEIQRRTLGGTHPRLAATENNLGELLRATGKLDEAETYFRRSLAAREQALGPEHPDVAIVLNNLAAMYATAGRNEEAEALYLRARAICEKALGNEHPQTALVSSNLADVYRAMGRDDQAEDLYRRAAAVREKRNPGDPALASIWNNLAAIAFRGGRMAEAEDLLRRALGIRETAAILNNLSELMLAGERYEAAEMYGRRALDIERRSGDKLKVARSLVRLAEMARMQRHLSQAEALYCESLPLYDKATPEYRRTLERLAEIYKADGRKSAARRVEAEAQSLLPNL